eukprot:scaffold343444_cov16-Prasinocladus_malaysianus.AAC.1
MLEEVVENTQKSRGTFARELPSWYPDYTWTTRVTVDGLPQTSTLIAAGQRGPAADLTAINASPWRKCNTKEEYDGHAKQQRCLHGFFGAYYATCWKCLL